MFSDIIIHKIDTDGKILTLPVPIAYGSKEKYITMNATFDKEGQKLQIHLPQISFLLTNIGFDTARKVNPINVNLYKDPNNNLTVKSQFVQVPIELGFDLYIMTRTTDDAFQIIESIVPFFHNSFTNNVKLFPEMDLAFDCRTSMAEGINIEDNFTGTSDNTKYMIHTMTFKMKSWMAGPVSNSGLIKRVQVDLIPVADDEYEKYGRQSRIVVTPGLTSAGAPTEDLAATIPYSEIKPTDPYGFVTQLFFFQDGLKFSPTRLQDVLPPHN